MGVKWMGSQELTEQPESQDWSFDGPKTRCTRVWRGPYAACLAQRPAHGAQLADMGAEYTVQRARVTRVRGTVALLTVEVEADNQGNPAALSTHYEIEWQQSEKPLRTHPRYAEGGVKALTAEDDVALKAWEAQEDTVAKKDLKYRAFPDDTDLTELSANAKDYAGKVLKGIESYLIYQPVARRVRDYNEMPTTGGCGFTETPGDFPALPERRIVTGEGAENLPFVWLKTADRATPSGDQGRYTRNEEWTGFDAVDGDLYPEAP